MDFQKAILYYPERLILRSCVVIGLAAFAVLGLGLSFNQSGLEIAPYSLQGFFEPQSCVPLSFQLVKKGAAFALPIPDLHQEIEFFLMPPRPTEPLQEAQGCVRLKKSGLVRTLNLPVRLDLAYKDRDLLVFSGEQSPFWIELQDRTQNEVKGSICLQAAVESQPETKPFSARIQNPPVQTASELPESSVFRPIAEAKWVGADLVRARYGHSQGGAVQRLEWGGEEDRIELQMGQWAEFRDGKWQVASEPDKSLPIMRLQSAQDRQLVLEGWQADQYVRLAFAPAAAVQPKGRPEELFSAVRVRSDRQMSCMLEKQCLILKTGDWVVKTKGRWKILRRKEDRDAFLDGKWAGELFVFEAIETRQGQKVVQGRLFHPNRSQMVSIELPAQARKTFNGAKPK